MDKPQLSPLKIAGLVLTLVGAVVATAVQKQEIEHAVDKALAEREARKSTSPSVEK